MASHVSTVSKVRILYFRKANNFYFTVLYFLQEKFAASFIPHTAGRHRLDIKFNGEKVPPGRIEYPMEMKEETKTLKCFP